MRKPFGDHDLEAARRVAVGGEGGEGGVGRGGVDPRRTVTARCGAEADAAGEADQTLVAEGKANNEIAAILAISPNTVAVTSRPSSPSSPYRRAPPPRPRRCAPVVAVAS